MMIRRSLLMMPINVSKFVDKAAASGADAVMLDMEDAVAPDKKEEARQAAAEAVKKASEGGMTVFVRVNNSELLEGDLMSALCPDLYGYVLPKSEDPEQIRNLDEFLSGLEKEADRPEGSLKLSLLVETPAGILNLQDMLKASNRIDSVIFGSEDYCRELGIEHSETNRELLLPLSQIVMCCKAYEVLPIGLYGSVAEFRDLELFGRYVKDARNLGCEGGFCIHPKQVAVLNEAYTPSEEEATYARQVVETYEEAMRAGSGAVSLNGKMIDVPVYERALTVLEKVKLSL